MTEHPLQLAPLNAQHDERGLDASHLPAESSLRPIGAPQPKHEAADAILRGLEVGNAIFLAVNGRDIFGSDFDWRRCFAVVFRSEV